MTGARLLIDFAGSDPVAGLLAAQIGADGTLQTVTASHMFGPQDTVWFCSQNGFFDAVDRCQSTGATVNVIVRRAAKSPARHHPLQYDLLKTLVAKVSGFSLRLFALGEAAATEIRASGLECEPLVYPQGGGAQTFGRAEFNAGQSRFRLLSENRDSVLDFDAINWARLARDYRLSAVQEDPPDLIDMAEFANRLPAKQPADRSDFLFVTPNGVGLGHLTRQLAIAKELQNASPDPDQVKIAFWCFSRAATIIQRAGYSVFLRHNADHLGADTPPWQQWETQAFAHHLRHSRPTAVIADGSRIEPFIVDAMKQPGCHHARLFWIRRGMWRADADDRSLADVRFCDRVLIPGDLASAADPGATARSNPHPAGLSSLVTTAPVVLSKPDDRLTRRAARRALGIGIGRGKTCLVSLGGEAFARTSIIHDKLIEAARKARVRLIWAQSPMAARPSVDNDNEERVSLYPVTPYLAAFDGVVAATGYNTFHELMLQCTCPVLFVPTTNERLDDQAARARFASEQGWAEILEHETGEEEEAKLDAFFQQLRQSQPVSRPALRRDGAIEMATEILNATTARGTS